MSSKFSASGRGATIRVEGVLLFAVDCVLDSVENSSIKSSPRYPPSSKSFLSWILSLKVVKLALNSYKTIEFKGFKLIFPITSSKSSLSRRPSSSIFPKRKPPKLLIKSGLYNGLGPLTPGQSQKTKGIECLTFYPKRGKEEPFSAISI